MDRESDQAGRLIQDAAGKNSRQQINLCPNPVCAPRGSALDLAMRKGIVRLVQSVIHTHSTNALTRHKKATSMAYEDLQATIDAAFDSRESLSPKTEGSVREAVENALALLDRGKVRVAEKTSKGWTVNQWLKKAVLLGFQLNDMTTIPGGPGHKTVWWDKVPSKFEGWTESEFRQSGFRAVPNCTVRHSAYIAPNVVLMPSFVNLGAYVDTGAMIDTWATVGSCAQIGKNVHLSGGAGIGGVLEPLQASPVIIEDNCFIGARSEVVEGVVVEEGSVLSMGVFIGASTKIINRSTGEMHMGRVPPYSVVVPGTWPGKPLADGSPGPSLYCAVIIKQVDAQTRSKTSINDLLRI